jgi:hypothetical protein
MGFPGKMVDGIGKPGGGGEPPLPTGEPAATPAPSGAPATGAPDEPAKPQVPPDAANLPRLELFDRAAGAWREVPGLASGKVLEIRGPARFVDPASGTILVRLTNDRQDAVSLQLAVQLEGTME